MIDAYIIQAFCLYRSLIMLLAVCLLIGGVLGALGQGQLGWIAVAIAGLLGLLGVAGIGIGV
jgi:hypothetical protein